MKLMTHNMLSSKGLKGVQVGYPLKIEAKDVKVLEVEFSPQFIARIIPKLEWPEVIHAAKAINQLDEDMSTSLPEDWENNEEFLRKAHHLLLEVEVLNGDLVCPETGRKFQITDGVPNMLLNENEV